MFLLLIPFVCTIETLLPRFQLLTGIAANVTCSIKRRMKRRDRDKWILMIEMQDEGTVDVRCTGELMMAGSPNVARELNEE